MSTVEEGKETREVSLEMKNLAMYYWDGRGVT